MHNPKQDHRLIEEFSRNRDALIDRLELGELDKSDYILENVQYFDDLGRGPFDPPFTCFEEGLFNYQYFNVMAKNELMRAEALLFRDPEAADLHREKAYRYYDEKDQGLMHLLENVGYHRIEAYPVETQSRHLRGELFEIIVKDRPRAIFHSKNKVLLKRLKHKNAFVEEERPSKIDAYINAKY